MPLEQKKKKGLLETFADKAESVDPTGIVKKLRGKTEAPPEAEEGDFNYKPPTPGSDSILDSAMNRQNKVKKTFAKIPGKK